MIIFLTSTSNPKIKQVLNLREKRERDRTGLFLIEGYRECLRAIESNVLFEKFFFSEELFLGSNENDLIQKIEKGGSELISCSKELFSKISYRDRPDGLLAVAKSMNRSLSSLEKKLPHPPLFVVLEAIEKPGNLGTILRSTDAAGGDGVIVVDRCTDIYNPNVVRASIGSLFTQPVIEEKSLTTIDWLKKEKIKIIAATPSAKKLYTDLDLTGPIALTFGSEQLGLTSTWLTYADEQVRIPMYGKGDSLNVAMAATILLYEAQRQRKN